MTTHELKNEATKLGQDAQRKGEPRIPFLDLKVMRLINECTTLGGSRSLIKAFIAGWDQASLTSV